MGLAALAATCGWLAACGSAPPAKPAPLPTPPPSMPLLIAAPASASALAALEARVVEAADSQMLLRFNVDAAGGVSDTRVLMSALAPDTQAAVLAEFAGLQFKPWLHQGKPGPRDFIYPLFFGPDAEIQATRFFCLHQGERYAPADRCEVVEKDGWRIYRVTLPYPPELLGSGVSGSVSLGFDIGSSGRPQNVAVIKSSPPGVFDALALASLRRWYFEPLGDTTNTTLRLHGTVTVNFAPPAPVDSSRPTPPANGGS